ncbi:MAG: hypothetical protein ABJK20_01970 [Halieaceae bacterium]
MAVDHNRIKAILGETDPSADTSLRHYALRRAEQKAPPRTLTPFEWEQWYAENGVPASHHVTEESRSQSFWQRLKSRVFSQSGER